MSVEIVFETHSISVDNERGIATGWLPGALSVNGRRLALELGQRRRVESVAVVFTSDLRRAVETAELAFGGTGIPIQHDARLRECNYGELNGMPAAQLQAERWRHVDAPFPGGESYRDVVARVSDFLHTLGRDWPGTRVVVIGHSATRLALDHLIDAKPLEDLVRGPFEWQPGWRYVLKPAVEPQIS
jgi:2,3-bisphosphoglycerate-dependent phosphoglycerate mutase